MAWRYRRFSSVIVFAVCPWWKRSERRGGRMDVDDGMVFVILPFYDLQGHS
jgi:hypothetical protein